MDWQDTGSKTIKIKKELWKLNKNLFGKPITGLEENS